MVHGRQKRPAESDFMPNLSKEASHDEPKPKADPRFTLSDLLETKTSNDKKRELHIRE